MEKVLRALACGLIILGGCGDPDEGGPVTVVASGSAELSDAVFKEDEVNDFHLEMSPSDWDSIIWDTMGDTSRRCTLRWGGQVVEDVAVRPSGSATRIPGNPKMSMKLDFNEFVPGRKFMGLKSLKLDGLYERTMLREGLSYWVFRGRLRAAPRTAYCRLHVNGEFRGVYQAEERVTSDLVRRRYGGEAGNLYRIRVERPEAFTYLGSDPDLYMPQPFEPKTHELDGDHSAIPRALDVLNHRPAEVETVFDMENVTAYLAIEAAIISYDGILRDAGSPHNSFLYQGADGRFELIPWDLDQTWSDSQSSRDIFYNFDNTRIAAVVRDTPALQARYKAKLAEILETGTHPDRVAERLESTYRLIRRHVYEDPYKRITNEEFDAYPDYLTNIARNRYRNLKEQLGLP